MTSHFSTLFQQACSQLLIQKKIRGCSGRTADMKSLSKVDSTEENFQERVKDMDMVNKLNKEHLILHSRLLQLVLSLFKT